jgi:hypothetical protein
MTGAVKSLSGLKLRDFPSLTCRIAVPIMQRMAQDQFRAIVESIRARLQAELDAQLGGVQESYERTLSEQRQIADTQHERALADLRDSVQAEHQRELTELQQAAAAEQQRSQAELRRATEAERERALAALRHDLEAEHQRAVAELQQTLESEHERALAELHQTAERERERALAELRHTSAAEHERVAADLRQTAEADAERRWADRFEAARAEWDARMHAEVAAARSEVERTMVAASMRARVEAEQAAADTASRARRDVEQAIADERRRADEDLARVKADAEEVRQRVEQELAQIRAARDAERASAANAIAEAGSNASTSIPSGPLGIGAAEILDAIRAIDNSTSLSDALSAVTRAAASQAPRAAMFVVNGAELREWPVTGVESVDAGPIRADGREAGFLSDVLRRGEALTIGQHGGTPPEFARLAPGRSAIAVPFTLGGQPVAVLYADEGRNGQASGPWRDTVQILGRHASAFLAYLTALKTNQAMHLLGAVQQPPPATSGVEDDAHAARRYARLLVSEIKLYNDGAVRAGRERRDLMRRLKPEIDRARRLYDERVPASVLGRDTYFQQELVQTLAGGDQALLG